jgi:hypothetical protein
MKTLHKGKDNELTITETNGRINVMTRQEVESDNYYMNKQKDSLEMLKLIFIGVGIALCLLIGFRIIKLF